MVWTSLFGKKKLITGVASDRKEDLIFLRELIDARTGKTALLTGAIHWNRQLKHTDMLNMDIKKEMLL